LNVVKMIFLKSTVCLLLLIAFPAAWTELQENGNEYEAGGAASKNRRSASMNGTDVSMNGTIISKNPSSESKNGGASPSNTAMVGGVVAVMFLGITVIAIGE
jgi:hypothetical protein